MKQLTLALLLSVAPAVLKADDASCSQKSVPVVSETKNKCGNCDRAEQANDDRCCGLAELIILDAEVAFDASQVTITVSGDTTTAEGWECVNNYVSSVYGTATIVTATSMSWVLSRGERTLVEWFVFLAEVESAFGEVETTVTSACDGTANVTLQLS